MSAPVSEAEIKSARHITEEEWRELRLQSLHGLPEELAGGGIPDVLLGYQKALLASTAQHHVTVVEKSRRTGATWALGADAVLTSAASRPDGGMDTFYIGYNLDMAREFIDVCAMWARAFDEAASDIGEFVFKDRDENGKERDIQAFRIYFASGFEIVALASRPRSLRGRQGYVIVDEAAFHDDLEALLKAAFALLIWGGKVAVLSTHDGEDNPFNNLVQDVRAGRRPYNLVRFDFDEALKDGLYQRICLVTAKQWSVEAEAKFRSEIIGFYGEGADEELFCIPSKGSGTFLPGHLIRAAMSPDIPVIRWEPPADLVHRPESERASIVEAWCEDALRPHLDTLNKALRHCFGEDFARVADLTVIWPFVIQRTMDLATPFVVELRNVPFECQKQILFFILDRMPRLSGGAMDATGNGAYLAEVAQQKYGASLVEAVHFTTEWYRENTPKFKAAFEDGSLLIPKDDDVYTDLRVFKKIAGVARIPTDKRTLELASQTRKRHGDAAIAALLGHYASEIDAGEFAYRPIHEGGDDIAAEDGAWPGRGIDPGHRGGIW
ncbi:phage FluMu gp28-like protein [Rhodobium orientis]|uniref:Mu-like prophage FluMu protein gp28 n=1 Tax=Rhodobium orientis TaxID=34017 RepID=A0A327JK15_9HYPH|nr:terminase family protein [Rhodobium orientis]MBB4302340.1 phage FluMu gp28-like protein [Rhodobium orientis]MBK5949045.1 hypothetical protein [Rhodobium orientis]RAI26627.1 hypothetical protein CH339_13585 [Rhodobium orientis]